MTTTLDRAPRVSAVRVGTIMALTSAATFGSSGAMGKALIETGWTAGAAVLVRLGGAAVVLGVAAAISLRGRLRLRAASLRTVLVYGVVAMAGAQLAFFNAVRTLDVGVALLLEFLAPVLLLALVVRADAHPASTTDGGWRGAHPRRAGARARAHLDDHRRSHRRRLGVGSPRSASVSSSCSPSGSTTTSRRW